MKAYEYFVVHRGDRWVVRTSDRPAPWAVYPDRSQALQYAREAARQKTELDGIPTSVRLLTGALGYAGGPHMPSRVGVRLRPV